MMLARKKMPCEERVAFREKFFIFEGKSVADTTTWPETLAKRKTAVKGHFDRLKKRAAELRGNQKADTSWSPEEVLQTAYEQGAILAGLTPYFDPYFGQEMCAVVVAVEMDRKKVKLAGRPEFNLHCLEKYDEAMEIVNGIAEEFLNQGIFCEPIAPSSGFSDETYEFDLIDFGAAAGLGEIGAHHMLITDEYGPSHRLALAIMYPNAKWLASSPRWVGVDGRDRERCMGCDICIKSCPSGALATGNIRQCTEYFVNNHACGVCMKVCPTISPVMRKKKNRIWT
jgi:ferredoxin